MKFSVLMAVYKNDNPEHFRVALESITINQTIKPNQVVIVQDGPVSEGIDKVINMVITLEKEIAFTVIKKEINQGLASALNDGLIACDYEYVARMDADDYAVPERFSKQLSYLQDHPEVDVLGGTIAEFNENPLVTESIRVVGKTHEDIIRMAKRRTPFNHMTVFYKKSKVLAVGGYNVEYGKLEDYKLWVDLISSGCRLANIEDVLIHMRVGEGMIERRSDKREILDWDKLQIDLLQAGIINRYEAVLNRVYIRVFTYIPVGMKKTVYKVFLRKRHST